MSEAKFTPGEWEIRSFTTADKWIDIDGPAAQVDYDDVNHEEQAANARLIAAAPEMYAKLEKILEWIERLAERSEEMAKTERFPTLKDAEVADAKNHRATAADIRKVLAKAQGQ